MLSKLYRLKDTLNAAGHYAATGGVIAATAAIGSPYFILGAAGYVAYKSFNAHKGRKNYEEFAEDSLRVHPEKHKFSPNLGKMAKTLYEKSGLKKGKERIHGFRVDAERMIRNGQDTNPLVDSFKDMFNKEARLPNAQVMGLNTPLVMITEPLLDMLTCEEEEAVLAHEFVHAASMHLQKSIPQKFMQDVAVNANTITFGATVVTSTFSAGLGGLATYVVGGALAQAGIKATADSHDPHLKLKIGTARGALALGIVQLANPAFLPVCAATVGLSMGAGMLTKSFSRSNEYQADRGAIEYGANPLAMITALRKVNTALHKAAGIPEPKDQPFIQRELRNLFSTHPTLERRVAKLSDIARKAGFSDAEIDNAANGELQYDQHSTYSNKSPKAPKRRGRVFDQDGNIEKHLIVA